MAQDVHTTTLLDGSTNLRSDRVILGEFRDNPVPAGGAAGASVQVTVPFKGAGSSYGVVVTPSMDAVCSVAKTATGFTVTLSPRLAANTLPSGTFDALVFA